MDQFYLAGADGFKCGFQVLVANFGSGFVAGVYAWSILTEDVGFNNTITINGLLTSPTPASTDPGWLSTSTTDQIWMKVPINSAAAFPFTFNDAVIESLGNGDTYGGGEVENDGGSGSPTVYTQTFARITLATMTSGAHGNPVVQFQRVTTGLYMEYYYKESFDSSMGSDEVIFCSYPTSP